VVGWLDYRNGFPVYRWSAAIQVLTAPGFQQLIVDRDQGPLDYYYEVVHAETKALL